MLKFKYITTLYIEAYYTSNKVSLKAGSHIIELLYRLYYILNRKFYRLQIQYITLNFQMSKGITPADDYKFTLTNELKEIAEAELRETKSNRDHALKAMRDWIATNPRINTARLGNLFLRYFIFIIKRLMYSIIIIILIC